MFFGKTYYQIVFCLLVLGGIRPVGVFNGNVVREGPLTLTIGSIKEVTEYNVPREVEVGVENGGELPLKVQLQMGGGWWTNGMPREKPKGDLRLHRAVK